MLKAHVEQLMLLASNTAAMVEINRINAIFAILLRIYI